MAGPIALAVNDRTTEAEVFTEDGALCVRLDGAVHRTELLRTNQSGLYSLLVDGRSFEIFARERPGGYELLVGNRTYQVDLGRRRADEAQQIEGTWTLTSPMTGQVSAVGVQAGDTVEQGQMLVTVESMKMNNELTAARAGRVAELFVAPGDRVERGKPLARIE